jgi:cytidylate kinase
VKIKNPDSEYRGFLFAFAIKEAQKKLGKIYTYEQSLRLLSERDKRNQERKVALFIIPDDAIVIDNSAIGCRAGAR